jgi:uncharacterized membrane protein (UPF0127 family)
MRRASPSRRFAGAPTVEIGSVEVPVAVGARARFLGLACLDLDAAGTGLLIPRCSSVHTFGMRFDLDVHFLDERGRAVATRTGVPPRRLVGHRRAVAVLELPTVAASGNFRAGGGESAGASAG